MAAVEGKRTGIRTAVIVVAAVVVAVCVGGAAYALSLDYSSKTAPYTPPAAPTPTEAAGTAAPAYPGARFIVAVDDQHAWRAASGKCARDTGWIESTADGGTTWTASVVAEEDRTAAVLGLTAASAESSTVEVQTAAECAPAAYTTTDTAGSWSPAAEPDGIWYIQPSDYRIVTGTGTVIDSPCAGRRIYGHDANSAMLVCTDGVVFRTSDAGVTWGEGSALPGVLSVASTKAGYLVAMRGDSGCQGIQFRTAGLAAGAGDGSVIGCYPVALGDGATAVAVSPGGIWVWVQNRVEHVTDAWALNL